MAEPARAANPAESPYRVLLIGPAWVGDMVMAQALVAELLKQRADTIVDLVAPSWTLGLVGRMPGVAEGIPLDVAHGELGLRKRWQLAQRLRHRYQRAIVLPNSLKSALLPWLARIPLRSGWRGEWRYGLLNDLRKLDTSALPMMLQRLIALAGPDKTPLPARLPQPRLQTDPQRGTELAESLGLDHIAPVIALCPGAEFGPAKRWPISHFTALSQHYIERGWQVLLMGSARDRDVTGAIRAALPTEAHCYDLAGKTSLADAIDLLALANAVVSNDSGLMHVAAALDRPLVALFGPTSSEFTPPASALAQIVELDLACRPCGARNCPLGHQQCLEALAPERVIAAVDAQLRAA